MHGAAPRLNNEDERQSAPLTGTLYCTSTHRASSRYAGETGTRKPPKQRTRGVCLCAAPAYVHSARAAFCCLSTACSPHQAPLCGLASWPAWRLLHESRRAILDFDLAYRQSMGPDFQPALLTGLMAPAWYPAMCSWGVIPDFIPHA